MNFPKSDRTLKTLSFHSLASKTRVFLISASRPNHILRFIEHSGRDDHCGRREAANWRKAFRGDDIQPRLSTEHPSSTISPDKTTIESSHLPQTIQTTRSSLRRETPGEQAPIRTFQATTSALSGELGSSLQPKDTHIIQLPSIPSLPSKLILSVPEAKMSRRSWYNTDMVTRTSRRSRHVSKNRKCAMIGMMSG